MFSPPLQCGWSRRRARRREYWPKPISLGPFEYRTTSFPPPKPISDEVQQFNQANIEAYHSYLSFVLFKSTFVVSDSKKDAAGVCRFPFSNLKQTLQCTKAPSESLIWPMQSLGRDPLPPKLRDSCAAHGVFHEVASRVIPKCNYWHGQCMSMLGHATTTIKVEFIDTTTFLISTQCGEGHLGKNYPTRYRQMSEIPRR